MKKSCLTSKLLIGIFTFLMMSSARAGYPMWLFTPLTSTSISVSTQGVATILYLVTNQSGSYHVLTMDQIPGVSQVTTPGYCPAVFALNNFESCILNLTVTGSALPGNVSGGPVVCQQGSRFQCYQPCSDNALNITKTTPENTSTLTPSVTSLALSVNDTSTNAALTGTPRTIFISNTGNYPANNISITYPTWPTGTTASSTCGASLAAGNSCSITITPGANATSACQTGIAPTPGNIILNSDATPATMISVLVLNYGCEYQGGYIFTVDDTTPNTGNIGGKVVSTVDQAPRFPAGVVWSPSDDIIFGISETSTAISPDPASNGQPGQFACDGNFNGACNTNNIFVYYQMLFDYAAVRCENIIAGFSGWYLPAACEMGPDDGIHTPAGCTAGMQNIVDSLPDLLGDSNLDPDTSCARGYGCLTGFYNSSTELASDPQFRKWNQRFSSGTAGPSYHEFDVKNLPLGVRCTRAF